MLNKIGIAVRDLKGSIKLGKQSVQTTSNAKYALNNIEKWKNEMQEKRSNAVQHRYLSVDAILLKQFGRCLVHAFDYALCVMDVIFLADNQWQTAYTLNIGPASV